MPHDHVEFIDNQPVLTLIEGKRTGILGALDDEVIADGMGKGSDEGFIAAVSQNGGTLMDVSFRGSVAHALDPERPLTTPLNSHCSSATI